MKSCKLKCRVRLLRLINKGTKVKEKQGAVVPGDVNTSEAFRFSSKSFVSIDSKPGQDLSLRHLNGPNSPC